jgi:uncharacterized damage-inducible protein DinB
VPWIKRCLGLLTEEEIWRRPNAETVSVGNLVLHLCGNVRQWIITGIGGAPDSRRRDEEFTERGPIPTTDLIEKLEATVTEAIEVIRRVTPEELLRRRAVQRYEQTGMEILVHVVEHFSYHTGQISLHAKIIKGVDLNHYPDLKRGVEP